LPSTGPRQLVLQLVPHQRSDKCKNNYNKGKYTATEPEKNSIWSPGTTTIAENMAINPKVAANEQLLQILRLNSCYNLNVAVYTTMVTIATTM
jgi:hypothetical protein